MLPQILAALALPLAARAQTYSATYLPSNVPPTTEQGQSGTNQCGTGSNQTSMCQNVYINSVDDFCIFGPPQPGPDSVIGNTERIEVSWCIKSGYGTRLIPDGAITGAHFVQTPDYVQVTGVGDLTKINIPAGDAGGELDPHGADGNGNPIGGLVFSQAFGQLAQLHEWTNFVAFDEFCIRGCKDGPNAPALCQHIYDVMGCFWNMPGDYDAGVFEDCKGDSGEPMGVYGASTFHQGDPTTPPAHSAPAVSQCTPLSTIGNLAAGGSTSSSVAASTTSSPAQFSISSSASSSGASSTPSSSTSQTGSIIPSSASAGSSPATSGPSHTSSTSSTGASPTGGASNDAHSIRIGWELALAALGVVAGGVVAL
ncbi:hypothetical protein PsYK624_011520 [Phanerochaete sordida]|uniref:Macrofage activating glycoprotein n=1 Tax=Phanerochaete sordida TaxID=48140 RepID=A0A9P3L7K7_9APHY|nr:hypothetical protein PsYK624_011520 [Phanerochaete sordida]